MLCVHLCNFDWCRKCPGHKKGSLKYLPFCKLCFLSRYYRKTSEILCKCSDDNLTSILQLMIYACLSVMLTIAFHLLGCYFFRAF